MDHDQWYQITYSKFISMLSWHLCIFSNLKKSRVVGRLDGYNEWTICHEYDFVLSQFLHVFFSLTFVCIIALIILWSWGEYCFGNDPVLPDLIFAARVCCVFAWNGGLQIIGVINMLVYLTFIGFRRDMVQILTLTRIVQMSDNLMPRHPISCRMKIHWSVPECIQ